MTKVMLTNQALNQREVRKFLSSVGRVTRDKSQRHTGRFCMV